MLVDTHAHLDPTTPRKAGLRGASFSGLRDILARAKEAGVNKIICVGTSVEASKKCVEIAGEYSSDDLKIWATAGIHAQDGKDEVEKFGEEYIEELKKVAKSSNNVVAIGECGFDFYLDGEKRIKTVDKDREFQRDLFKAQIELAMELKLPLVIHCRNAFEETFGLLSKPIMSFPRLPWKGKRESRARFRIKSGMTGGGLRGVFHSWTGNWETAQKALDLGFYISFSGIVTFKNALNVQEVAKKMPIDKMLLETDSPFLSPEPLLGKTNEPKNVKIVAEFIAKLRNLPIDELCDITSENAEKLFKFNRDQLI